MGRPKALACIFDMDGVISDTQKIHARIEAELLASFGITITPEEITRRFAGVSLREQCTTLFAEFGIACPDLEELSRVKLARFHACEDEIAEMEGARMCIDTLHPRVPLAVGSGLHLASIGLVLGKLDLVERFRAIASAQEVPRGKPAPDVFLLAAKRLGVEPSACVVIEDAVSGMIAARAAGMRCVALVDDIRREWPADIVVEHLRDVPFDWFV
jgi:HAD superfamily hydrolase (TIGR01509 family)